MRSYSVIVVTLSLALLLGETKRALAKSKGSSKKVCNHVECCTANQQASLTLEFLFEFEQDLPLPLCTTVQTQLEHDFVISYNYLARLGCDSHCFRRATRASIVSAPEGAFTNCDGKTTHHDPYYRTRTLEEVQVNNAFIVQVEFEQSGQCTTALDGKRSTGKSTHPREYQKACGKPAWAFDYEWPSDKHKICPDPAYDDAVCCCACGAERTLSEKDVADLHKQSKTIQHLGLDLFRVRELYSRDVCSQEEVELKSSFLLIFAGDASLLLDADNADGLVNVVAGEYNGLAFENCDVLGRQISGGTLDVSDVRRRLQKDDSESRQLQQAGRRYANGYPSNACARGACVGSNIGAQAKCPPNQCAVTSGATLFDLGRRRLDESGKMPQQQQTADAERILVGGSLTSTPDKAILEQCLCPVHEENATGSAPASGDFVTRFNRDLQASGLFPELGELLEAIEFKVLASAGVPQEFHTWLPVYVKGYPCALSQMDEQALADLIQVSYNDMVVEECDVPLFRQISSAWTWTDPYRNCVMNEFVVYIHVKATTSGKVDPHNPLFSPYKASRRMESDTTDQHEQVAAPFNPAYYIFKHRELEVFHTDMPPVQQSNQFARKTQEVLGEAVEDGVCLIEGAENPRPPSIASLESRVNENFPTSAISYISILTEPLCRCEGFYEYFYYSKRYPKSFDEYGTMNGIYVVPHSASPCYRGRRLGRDLGLQLTDVPYVFPCFSN